MVNGSQCKISGAVGHAWEYAHAQWADDRVAALHMHGGLRMRSKRTTTWQLLTRSQIETKLIVSLCFWSDYQHLSQAYGCFWSMYFNPSLSGMMSRRRTAAGPPTDDTSVPHALLALHLELSRLWTWPLTLPTAHSNTKPAVSPTRFLCSFICTCTYSPYLVPGICFHM